MIESHFVTSVQHQKGRGGFKPITVFQELGSGRFACAPRVLSDDEKIEVYHLADNVPDFYSPVERVGIALQHFQKKGA